MLRIPGMPLLPGTQFRDLTKTNFSKSQTFLNYYGVPMLSDREPPALVSPQGAIVDSNCPPPELPSVYPPKVGPKLPAWLAYDKQCLCFKAYFKETLQEVYHAPYLVRRVKIYYYLEDGTMQVSEPRTENSGLPQGCLIHRQRVPKPPPCQDEFISILDLNVNQTIQMFDRVYHITDCDLFTRHFLNKAGIPVPDPVETPTDPTEEHRKRQISKIALPSDKKFLFAQFLAFDRKVLRFYGYWDDRSEFGDVRNLEVCYYLADDTMDVHEKLPANSGREGPSMFLKRGKLPREWQGLPLPGEITDKTLLNVLGGGLATGRYVGDCLGTGKKDIPCYTDRDLQIGAVINVYGRRIVLTGCDDFTKNYYRKKYGLEDFSSMPRPSRFEERVPLPASERVLPPYNGWGSFEDSAANCRNIVPKRPHKDFKKFIALDKFILRFGAKLISTIKDNCERMFIIKYFLSDDTVQIYEVAARNSGFQGGEFSKRRRIFLPNQEVFSSKEPATYKPYHFFIGSTVNLKDHVFTLVSADEYTLIYMEAHPEQFPLADVNAIMHKVREAIRPNYKDFVAKYVPETINQNEIQLMNYETLKRSLIEVFGKNITDHEIITLCRYYSAEQEPPRVCDRETVRAAVHLEIRRNLWDDLDNLKEHLHHVNPMNKAFICETKLKAAIKGCRLPLSAELIDDLFMVLIHNDEGHIEVCDFMAFINVSCNPAPDIAPINYAFELCPKIPFLHKGRLVNWSCFIQHLGLEEQVVAKESE